MKILAIGYYDDYARFFLSIKKTLEKKDNNINFKYLNIYFSGFLYWLFNNKEFTNIISFKAWMKVLLNKSKYEKVIMNQYYKNINLDSIIRFDKTLNKLNEEDSKLLKLQACSYIDIIEQLLIDYRPNILLLSDDSKLVIEIIDLFAKKYKIKTFYFEQGPFGTTILDNKGVNANASIRNILLNDVYDNFENKKEKIDNFFNRDKDNKYKRNPIYRASDYILECVFKFTPFLPIDLRRYNTINNNTEIYQFLKLNKKLDKKIFKEDNNILLILQVPFDVNLVYHSPLFENHYDVVNTVFNSIPDGYNLIIREHPLYKSKYENELYEIIKDNQNIYLDIDSNLSDTMENSSIIIVNNSTVGIESIAKFKNTIVLGNSYYDNNQICFKLENKEELDTLIKKALTIKLNKKLIVDYLYKLCFNFLIDGHFRDNNLISSKYIVNKLLRNIYDI
jgi:capsular polysaccharide export protein